MSLLKRIESARPGTGTPGTPGLPAPASSGGNGAGGGPPRVLTFRALCEVERKLLALSLAERTKLPGLDPRRADTIIPGAVLHNIDDMSSLHGFLQVATHA